MSNLTERDIARVKGMGFLRNRGTDTFSARIVTKNGVLTAEQLQKLSEIAKNIGAGRACLTSRLSVEIPGIPLEQVETVCRLTEEIGLSVGGTGAKVRPVTACKGTTCVYGNADTQAIAAHLHDEFYIGWHHVALPHKFKMAVGGCPNSCMKPSLNDIGIEGHRVPKPDVSKCHGCKECAVVNKCPSHAAMKADGKIAIDARKCMDCGVCLDKCPFGVMPEAETRFAVYVGGTWGRTPRMGSRLSRYYALEELDSVVTKVLLWYRANGYQKERLGATIDRLGLDALEKAIADDALLANKDAILAAELLQRP